ncbi:MAG: hypothetical protein ACK4UZ_01720 [Rhizobium rhizophilum]
MNVFINGEKNEGMEGLSQSGVSPVQVGKKGEGSQTRSGHLLSKLRGETHADRQICDHPRALSLAQGEHE